MLESWCERSENLTPVEVVGRLYPSQLSAEFSGILGALLFRSDTMGREIAGYLAHEGFPLPEGPFRLMLLALDDPEVQKLEDWKRYCCRINLYDHLRRWLKDRLEGQTAGFLFMQMGYLLGMFYGEKTPDCVTDACREAAGYAGEQLGVSIHITVSHTFEGCENVSTAYRSIQDVEQSRIFYTDMLDQTYVITGDVFDRLTDRAQKAEFEHAFFLSADRIAGSIRAGDQASAAGYIRDQLLRIAKNSVGLPFPTTLHLTTNRCISVMQNTLLDENLADWRYLEHRDFSRDLAGSPNLEAYLGMAETMAQDLIAHARQRSEASHDRLMPEIREYLENNATDMNMGLTAVAREFQIKPREAAESFRRYFGVNVNDVIHRTRVKKAKELILTTDDSIQSIAEAVGYCSLATMYRAFSNVEGVAPGKFRQNRGG